MKRSTFLLSVHLIFFSLLMLSCEKKKEEPIKPFCDQIDIVSSFTYPDNKLYPVARLTYDGMDRITLVQSDNHLRYAYTYLPDRIEVKLSAANTEDQNITYFLDHQGRITHTSTYNYDFRYDNSGYLVSFKKPILTDNQITGYNQVNLDYEGGNLTAIRYDGAPPFATFTYFDQPNQELGGYNSPLYLTNVLDGSATFYLIEAGFFGKSPSRLLKKISGNAYPGNEIKYQFDKKGRIIAKLDAHGFQYQCD